MAWPDSSTTHKPVRQSRPLYVPQYRSHTNNNPFPPYGNQPFFPPSDDSTHHFLNRSAPPRPRGRGGPGPGPGHNPNPVRRFPRHEEPRRNHRSPFETNGEEESGVVNFEAYESVPVEVSGENVPSPVNAFAETDLDEELKKNIERCKYVKPTPVQRYAIPIAVAGRDLMACAQTGSGKTAAFCFPIISGILKGRLDPELSSGTRGSTVAYPTALILSPTRELSCQVGFFLRFLISISLALLV